MARRKHPIEWTTEEAMRKLFPKRVVDHFKKAAREAEKSLKTSTDKTDSK